MRKPRFAGSSTATIGMPGISGSLLAMRSIVREPVSPAPTISVRGLSQAWVGLENARFLRRATR